MKKNLYLFGIGLFFLLFAITACKKDEDIPLSEILIGKWEVLNEANNTYVNNVIYEDTIIDYDDDEMVIEFVQSGTGLIYEYNDLSGQFTWELNGNTLTWSGVDQDDMDFEVLYNESKQEVTLTYSESEIIDNINFKYEMIITAKKL